MLCKNLKRVDFVVFISESTETMIQSVCIHTPINLEFMLVSVLLSSVAAIKVKNRSDVDP